MSSLLITNGMLVTLDDDNRFFRNGSVYVEDNVIVDVGDIDAASYSPERIVDAGGRLVMHAALLRRASLPVISTRTCGNCGGGWTRHSISRTFTTLHCSH